MTKHEFCERFTRRVIELSTESGHLPYNWPPEAYGEIVATVYWRHVADGGFSPEYWAEEDSAYWHEDASTLPLSRKPVSETNGGTPSS